jgi:transposase InsO family protein
MPWQTCNAMDRKRDFVELAAREGVNFRQLCRNFGISPPTGYKWLKRFRGAGLQGLAELPRRPRHSPSKASDEVERLILEARRLHPAWGARKLKRWLENRGHIGLPQPSTITEVLRRHHQLAPPARPDGHAWQRFQREHPNELWQMDFKGWIPLANGGRCHPLTVLDDCSRFNLVLDACRAEHMREVRPRLERAFARYGLPQVLLCDHGPPWGDAFDYFTTFEAWLMRVGVEVRHGRIRHPQTQGKEERFHRTLKAEVLSRTTAWRDLDHCQSNFESWREVYNHERPHEALAYEVPASRYRSSERVLPVQLREAADWYEPGELVKRVKSKGEITFRNVFWSIGHAFRGEDIVLRPSGEGRWEVFYCWKRLGMMDFKALAGKPKGSYERLSCRFDGPECVNDVSEQV